MLSAMSISCSMKRWRSSMTSWMSMPRCSSVAIELF